MTDSELQRVVLQKFYDERKSGYDFLPEPKHFNNDIDEYEIQRIELQLYDQELIRGQLIERMGEREFYWGRITPKGISIIENQSIDGNIPQFNSVNISNSSDFQIGNQNTMNITNDFDINYKLLLEKIEQADEPEEKKSKAIELLKRGVNFLGKEVAKALITNFLKNPNVDSIIITMQNLLQ